MEINDITNLITLTFDVENKLLVAFISAIK